MSKLQVFNVSNLNLEPDSSSEKYYWRMVPGKLNGDPINVKFINLAGQRDGVNIFDEASLLNNLSHPNIIPVLGIIISPELGFVIPKYQTLLGFMHSETCNYKLNSLQKKLELAFIAKSIILAIEYLHSKNIVNRTLDLHTVSVQLDNYSRISNAKLNDFFNARECPPNSELEDHETKRLCYNQLTNPPEMFKGWYSQKSDIWQLGLLVWLMYTGLEWPYDHNFGKLRTAICIKKLGLHDIFDIWKVHKESSDEPFIKNHLLVAGVCCQFNQACRPTATELLKMLQQLHGPIVFHGYHVGDHNEYKIQVKNSWCIGNGDSETKFHGKKPFLPLRKYSSWENIEPLHSVTVTGVVPDNLSQLKQPAKTDIDEEDEDQERENRMTSGTLVDKCTLKKKPIFVPVNVNCEQAKLFSNEDVTIVGAIGNGQFGQIWRAKLNGSKDVAIKLLHNDADSDAEDSFYHEMVFLHHFKHKYIVNLVGVCLNVHEKMLILEYFNGGDLKSFLDNDKKLEMLTIEDLATISLQVAEACKFIHGHEVVHGDLAARNVLLSMDPESGKFKSIAVADFGLSRNFQEIPVEKRTTDYMELTQKTIKTLSFPLRHAAPEFFCDEGSISFAADVYAYGVVLWEIYSYGEEPFRHVTDWELKHGYAIHHKMPRPTVCPVKIYSLMQSCWEEKCKDRPTFVSIVNQLSQIIEGGDVRPGPQNVLAQLMKRIVEKRVSTAEYSQAALSPAYTQPEINLVYDKNL